MLEMLGLTLLDKRKLIKYIYVKSVAHISFKKSNLQCKLVEKCDSSLWEILPLNSNGTGEKYVLPPNS